MQKFTPHDFAHLGFSCLLQSALDGGSFLRAPSPSSREQNLTACPILTGHEKQHDISFEWFLEPSEEKGYFHLVSAIDSKHPQLLHLDENFEQNGDPIALVEKTEEFENTKIRFDDVPNLDGYYHLSFFKHRKTASRSTDSKRVVHLDEATGKVTQWEKSPTPACYWRLCPSRLTPSDLIESGEGQCFAIENKTGDFLFLKGGSIFNGTQVTAGPFANQHHYKWRVKRAVEGKCFIVSAHDAHHDRVLQQHENSQDDGAKITLWELDPETKGNPCSMVKFEPAGDEGGNWCILFCHSNKYLQLSLGELTQAKKKSTQQGPEPNWCWEFLRCTPNFIKNA